MRLGKTYALLKKMVNHKSPVSMRRLGTAPLLFLQGEQENGADSDDQRRQQKRDHEGCGEVLQIAGKGDARGLPQSVNQRGDAEYPAHARYGDIIPEHRGDHRDQTVEREGKQRAGKQ